MTDFLDSGVVRVSITPSGVDVQTGSYVDTATVYVEIDPSGVDTQTGSGVDANTAYIAITIPFAAEGDWAISSAGAVVTEAIDPTLPDDTGGDPTETPLPTYNGPDDSDTGGGFIGEGRLAQVRFVANGDAAFNRFDGTETNRFTGVLIQ